jgi:hypothetical protein
MTLRLLTKRILHGREVVSNELLLKQIWEDFVPALVRLMELGFAAIWPPSCHGKQNVDSGTSKEIAGVSSLLYL